MSHRHHDIAIPEFTGRSRGLRGTPEPWEWPTGEIERPLPPAPGWLPQVL